MSVSFLDTIKKPAVTVQNKYPASEKNDTEKEMISMKAKIAKETSSSKNVNASDSNSQEVYYAEEASQGTVEKTLRRTTRSRKEPSWFRTNAMPGTFTKDKASVDDGLRGNVEEP